ncbi:UDP-N-acetylglucosamine--N-acetylmuramyl-(pentapeptide) pyrophosphoryl-undecaprenol N-acetylglucosamine transferase [Litorivivens lipolytica]|uniref:UDP-N-acetylglucosamine--N-acetylmuramyl-(pentapeptide) pyrophosphoryl-undecaprenol N-acetylglucosamine transferase n=1 Tax=Litorivivens lipolytica TaxID=1524264 RepID=A0A7W4W438_9GAMM|nr:undecaprenyldiphospho-muramoylpentapeptide beta-N-acetylglucosaminyltransferase [Litorivivens lipolytica]MBB3047077.1 UDP-N-acetylglucosamine--N-acetylmuramyl-(pentapeptide) pyrophosphoryl-undecaprenol N-acetylglucosamine transferase [Litorivivens lipolytica]
MSSVEPTVNTNGKRVLVMAGGTGGHVFPALAVAKALKANGVEVQWIGTERGIEARVVPANDIPLNLLPVQGIRGKGLLSRLIGIARAGVSVFAAMFLILKLRPVCVIGLGGYVAGPGGLAAWLTRTPLLIHEQNAVAGTTNRLLVRFATLALTGYPIALGGDKNRYIGNPVRDDIAALPTPDQRFADRGDKLRLLVLGGSQGALAINRAVVATLKQLPADFPLEVWHQTGAAHIDTVSDQVAECPVSVRAEAFIENMAEAYAWADVVLCRAGALTVAELTAAGVGGWLVPLPQAIDDHQRGNARWLEAEGAGEIIEQATLDAKLLEEKLRNAVNNRAQLLSMAAAARSLAKPDAAREAAQLCMECANG